MKYIKGFFKWVLILFALLIVFLYIFDYDYLIKAVRTIYLNGHKTAYLDDYKVFDNKIIAKGNTAQPWAIHKDYNKVAATSTLQGFHDELGTVAFLIIKNDSIWHEKYFDGYDKDSRSNSFSMAKSIVSASLGKAIMQGDIKSLDQPVADFFSEFSDGRLAKMTVGDLSSMASGLNWDESYYSPFSVTTRAYFDDNLEKVILGLEEAKNGPGPGKEYEYLSGNTQLLAMVVEKATGEKLPNYVSTNFWKPMGAENDAYWQVDSEENNLVKGYCCISSNARDFSRFGKLYKDHGKWNGTQILDSTFVAKSIRPRFSKDWMYGYGLWLLKKDGKDVFMLRGHLGQYVIVIPEDNIIITRLGHKKSGYLNESDSFTTDIHAYIDEAYKMLNR